MAETVNPIEGPFDSMPARKPGTVVVAMGSKGAVALRDGQGLTWGERVFGGYKAFYLVDISRRIMSETYRAPSSQQAFAFDTVVSWTVVVSDPGRVIEHGIRDLRTLFNTMGQNAVANTARSFTVHDCAKAEAAVRAAVMHLKIDPALSIIDVAVQMRPEADALKLLRSVQEEEMRVAAINAQSNVEAAARDGAKKALSTPEDLLAHVLVTKDEGYKAALRHRLEQAANEDMRRFEIFKALIENKIVEPQDFHARFPDFLNDVFKAIPATATNLNTKQLPSQAADTVPGEVVKDEHL
ncbi:MAG TPA: hypothetical protein VK548_08480 [Candidatus Acidoferrum sp.]|nr:hypothetical protein [Candidatus Acidoferrum sp.]